ncbi:putative viral protein TPX [Paratrimastix pyriformis]|uniref:Viral protein TPX n=1 Tax=Paratrimastix pyriformis TaxID=342808 RepID=A0ABQ8UB20_9EUKA|nr:putative viral protein TPX [Paratrimastix pyriformis]
MLRDASHCLADIIPADSILADSILVDIILADLILADLILADIILADIILADIILADIILADIILADIILAILYLPIVPIVYFPDSILVDIILADIILADIILADIILADSILADIILAGSPDSILVDIILADIILADIILADSIIADIILILYLPILYLRSANAQQYVDDGTGYQSASVVRLPFPIFGALHSRQNLLPCFVLMVTLLHVLCLLACVTSYAITAAALSTMSSSLTGLHDFVTVQAMDGMLAVDARILLVDALTPNTTSDDIMGCVLPTAAETRAHMAAVANATEYLMNGVFIEAEHRGMINTFETTHVAATMMTVRNGRNVDQATIDFSLRELLAQFASAALRLAEPALSPDDCLAEAQFMVLNFPTVLLQATKEQAVRYGRLMGQRLDGVDVLLQATGRLMGQRLDGVDVYVYVNVEKYQKSEKYQNGSRTGRYCGNLVFCGIFGSWEFFFVDSSRSSLTYSLPATQTGLVALAAFSSSIVLVFMLAVFIQTSVRLDRARALAIDQLLAVPRPLDQYIMGCVP